MALGMPEFCLVDLVDVGEYWVPRSAHITTNSEEKGFLMGTNPRLVCLVLLV